MREPTVVRHYHRRAASFFRTAGDLQTLILNDDDAAKYLPSIGLISVHSSIALADAVLVAEAGERSSGENHAEAADKRTGRANGIAAASGGAKVDGTRFMSGMGRQQQRAYIFGYLHWL